MKKIIAILAMVALVGGVAFAQVSGYAIGSMTIADGDDVGLSGGMSRINLEGSATTESEKFGVWMRFRGDFNMPVLGGNWTNPEAYPVPGEEEWDDPTQKVGNTGAWGYVFWQPIEQVKFQIGTNPDGHFGADRITRWGFYSRASDVFGGTFVDNNYYNPYGTFSDFAFFSGFGGDGWGAILTITPMEMLAINVGIPLLMGTYVGQPMEDTFKSAVFQVAAFVDSIANFHFTYVGAGEDDGTVFFSAQLTAIENIGIDVGFKYDLAKEEIGIGLGAQYDADAFSVKLRLFAAMPKDGDANIGFDILPSYAISDSLKIFCNIGVTLGNDPAAFGNGWAAEGMGFNVHPYITYSTGWDQNFYAGVRIEQPVDGDITWSIPIGIVVGF